MADAKITDLPEDAAPAVSDWIETVDVSDTTDNAAGSSKKVHPSKLPLSDAATTALAGKAASVHTHAIADTTGLQTALDGKAAASHTHTASAVTDFAEAVDDRVAALLVAGSGVTLTYDDGAGTLTVTASGGGSGSTSASDLTSGTLDDARLSANVPLKGAANTFTSPADASVPMTIAGASSDQAGDLLRFSVPGWANGGVMTRFNSQGGLEWRDFFGNIRAYIGTQVGNGSAFTVNLPIQQLTDGIRASIYVGPNSSGTEGRFVVGAYNFNGDTDAASVLAVNATTGRVSVGGASPGTGDGRLTVATVAAESALALRAAASQTALVQRFQAPSSTATIRDVGFLDAGFVDATDATRTGYVDLYVADYSGTNRKGLRVASDGTQSLIGLHGSTPVARSVAIADATDAASAVTQLNTLLAYLRSRGDIAS